MYIAESASATAQQYYFLAVFGDIAQIFARLGVICHCSAWHVDDFALAVGAGAPVYSAVLSVSGKYVALVFQV